MPEGKLRKRVGPSTVLGPLRETRDRGYGVLCRVGRKQLTGEQRLLSRLGRGRGLETSTLSFVFLASFACRL